jgi:hypothetical protein
VAGASTAAGARRLPLAFRGVHSVSRQSPLLPVFLALCLLLSGASVFAQTDAGARAEIDMQIKRVELALSRIQAEQQSVYQQFQMVQEMRRTEQQQNYQSSLVYTPPATPPNYDDIVRDQQAREARMQGYAAELDRLYARYRELEEQKRPLLDELSQLATQR